MSGKDEVMLCRMTASRWKEGKMVPTYFVSQKPKKGYYTKIRDALQHVPPFSRIEIVGGGTFREKLVIDKPIEVSVSKSSDPTMLIAATATLTLQAEEAFIEGLLIEVEGTVPCVTVASGSPTLKWCTLQAMEVTGNATPCVTECKLVDSKCHGLYLCDRAGGTYNKNTIHGHMGYSVLVESTGTPELSYNTIAGSTLGQVCIKAGEGDAEGTVRPHFLLNRISDNVDPTASSPAEKGATAGILPAYKLEALEQKELGMKVDLIDNDRFQATGDFENSFSTGDDETILKNSSNRCAVHISGPTAQPLFTRNTVSVCAEHGLWLRAGCSGTFETNYIASNKGWGVVVEGSKTRPTFLGNHINNNGGGMKVSGSPIKIEQGNAFFSNKGPQLYIVNASAKMHVARNSIRSGNKVGIWCTGRGEGQFIRNTFESCGVAFRVDLQANPSVDDCTFDSCGLGVFAGSGSLGQFRRCRFIDASLSAAVVQVHADPTFSDCDFTQGVIAVTVQRDGRGHFTQCRVRDIRNTGFDISRGGDPLIEECRVQTCGSYGVHVSHGGRGHLKANFIISHEGVPLCVETAGDPIVERNIVGHTAADGIVVEDGGFGTFVHNIIRMCAASGVSVSGALSAPTVRSNFIASCGTYGMHLIEGWEGTYEHNTVRQCLRASVCVAGRPLLDTGDGRDHQSKMTAPESKRKHKAAADKESAVEEAKPKLLCLRENVWLDSRVCGVNIERGARVQLQQNVIQRSAQAVSIRGASTVLLQENTIQHCVNGIIADEETELSLMSNRFHEIEGVAICSLSTKVLQAQWNTLTCCQHGFFLRRVRGGRISYNVLDRVAGYGAHLGLECNADLCHNRFRYNGVGISFAEVHVRASVFDNVIAFSTHHGIRISGDLMDKACCRSNFVVGGNVGVYVHQGNLPLETNVILNCRRGLMAAAKAKAPPLPTSPLDVTATTSISKFDKTMNKTMNSTLKGDVTMKGAAATDRQKCTQFNYCVFVACGHGAVSTAASAVALQRCLVIHNDIGVRLAGEDSSLIVEGCVIANSAAIGVYAERKAAGLLKGCSLFKNYINVAIESDATTPVTRCVLQSPVVFNCFVGGARTAPRFEMCLISSLACMSIKQGRDHLAQAGSKAAPAAPSAARKAEPAAAAAQSPSSMSPSRAAYHVLSSLVDICKDEDGGRSVTVDEPNSTSLCLSATCAQQCTALPSLWEDLYDEPLAWTDSSSSSSHKKDASTADADVLPFPCAERRSTLLWPRNVGQPGVLGGPGGPFLLHRMRTDHFAAAAAAAAAATKSAGGRNSSNADEAREDAMKNSFTYTCSGMWLDDSAAPVCDGCYFGSHVRMGTSASVTLGPNEEKGEQWCVDPRANWAASPRAGRLSSEDCSPALSPGKEAAKAKKKSKRKKEKEKTVEELLREGNERAGSKQEDCDEEAQEAPPIPSYEPPQVFTDVTHASPLGQLLLIGSPCYWRQYATSSRYFFQINPKFVARPAGAEEDKQDLAVVKKPKKSISVSSAKDTRASSPSGASLEGTQLSISTTMTEHITGCAVISSGNAAGTFQNCTFDANQHATRFGLGARTVFRRCRYFRQAGEALIFEERCTSEVHSSIFRDARTTHIRIRGAGTAPLLDGNDFMSESPFVSIYIEDRSVPKLVGNKFRAVQNDAIVVQGAAEPTIERNTFDSGRGGILFRQQSKGTISRNSFITMGEYAIKVADDGTSPTIDDNLITNGREAGLCASGYGASPTVRNNTFESNVTGVHLTNGAGGTYASNSFRHHQVAVRADNSEGFFRDNHMVECVDAGAVLAGAEGATVLKQNHMHSGKALGVHITGGRSRLEGNHITINAGEGCVVEGANARPVLVGNELYQNGGCGVAVYDSASPTLVCNLFVENKKGGLLVEAKDTRPVCEGNYFKLNQQFGLCFSKGAGGAVGATVVTATVKGPAMLVGDEAHPTVEDSVITYNTAGGLVVRAGGSCIARRCVFTKNDGDAAACVYASDEGENKMIGCVFVENALSFEATSSTNVELLGCGFLGAHSSGAAVRVGKNASPSFTHCLFALTKCGMAAAGLGRLKRCIFLECSCGLELQGGSSLFECELLACANGCVVLEGEPTFLGTLFAGCSKVGLSITNAGDPHVTECGMVHCGKGVSADSSAQGTLENNRIVWNHDNVVVGDDATTEIKSNLIYDAANMGVYVKNGAPRITDNDIFDNQFAALAVDNATGGLLEDNRISFPKEDGALVVKDNGEAKKIFAATSNTLRNSFSPPPNTQFKQVSERMQLYKTLAGLKERACNTYVDLRRLLDETASAALLRVTRVAGRAISSSAKKAWALKDGPVPTAILSPPSEKVGDTPNLSTNAFEADTSSSSGGTEALLPRWDRLPPDVAKAAAQMTVDVRVRRRLSVSAAPSSPSHVDASNGSSMMPASSPAAADTSDGLPPLITEVMLPETKACLQRVLDSIMGPSTGALSFHELLHSHPLLTAATIVGEVRRPLSAVDSPPVSPEKKKKKKQSTVAASASADNNSHTATAKRNSSSAASFLPAIKGHKKNSVVGGGTSVASVRRKSSRGGSTVGLPPLGKATTERKSSVKSTTSTTGAKTKTKKKKKA